MAGAALTRGYLYLAVVALALVACGAPSSGNLERNYKDAVRKIGITPVYPPREELQIGDILLVSVGHDENDTASIYLDSAPEIQQQAAAFLNGRIVFQPTVASGATSGQDDTFGTDFYTRSRARAQSLPAVAFPAIVADEGYAAGLGIGRLLSSIGLGGSDRTKVRLEFPDVRTYWLPAAELDYDRITRQVYHALGSADDNVGNYRDCIKSSNGGPPSPALKDRVRTLGLQLGREVNKRASVDSTTEVDQSKRTIRAVVVTQVYLARRIDYTYFNGKIIAAGVRIAEQGGTITKVPAPPVMSTNVIVNPDKTTDLAINPDTAITNASAAADAFASSGSMGDGFNFTAWSGRGMTFSKTYQHPVVVAWDGPPILLDGLNQAYRESLTGTCTPQK